MRTSCRKTKHQEKCPHYSHSLQRCKLGYVNPKNITDSVRAVMMGLLKPCPYTEKGVKVIEKVKAAYDKTRPSQPEL